MSAVPTVTIQTEAGPVVINASDLQPGMKLAKGSPAAPEPETAPEPAVTAQDEPLTHGQGMAVEVSPKGAKVRTGATKAKRK